MTLMKNNTETMANNLFVAAERRDQIIGCAATRRLGAVVTWHTDAGWLSYRTRILGCRFEDAEIDLEPPVADRNEPVHALEPGNRIGISFRRGHTKCLFNTVVLRCHRTGSTDEGSAETIAIRWPEKLQEMQRRVYDRVCPPSNQRIDITIHAEELAAGDGAGRRLVKGRLDNISAGGLSAVFENTDGLCVGQTVTCAFRPNEGAEPLLVDARLRHERSLSKGRTALGFQFVGLETTMEGQCRLAQLATLVSGLRQLRTRLAKRELRKSDRSR